MIFLIGLEISWTTVQGIHQNSEKWLLSVNIFFSGDDFEAVLAIFFSFDHGVKGSEAVEKITTDEKDYHK